MLSIAARERLVVVLVGARNPQNIGAAARALQDFGFRHLRVVNEYVPAFDAARTEATSAVGAHVIMREARRFDTLPEAIADCALIVGTTAVGERNLQSPVLPLRDAVPHLIAVLDRAANSLPEVEDDPVASSGPGRRQATSALLFGSEKSGLTKEQLSYCSLLLTIPLFAPEGRHLSMNLGQSVAVCLYELTRDGLEGARALPLAQETPAQSTDRERMLELLLQIMQLSGYAGRFPANARIEVVRQLVSKLGATRNEAATWTGLLRSIVQALANDTNDALPPTDVFRQNRN